MAPPPPLLAYDRPSLKPRRRRGTHLPTALTLVAILIMSTTMMTTSWAARWELLIENAGIASMHTAVTRYGSAVLLDRTNIGASEIALPKGVCRDNPQDQRLQHDCTAHSVLLSLSAPGGATATVRPLKVQTDTWCSSGQFTSDGTLWQTGGDFDGLYKIRSFAPCPDSSGDCDWVESDSPALQDARWYATNQLLPDGATQVVVGGRGVTSLEYVPDNRGRGKVYLDLLAASGDAQGDNMYPFVHLLPDGTLFVFANRDSVLYDPDADAVVHRFPTLPGEPRNYPSAGSSVLLPLVGRTGFRDPQVLICGGAQYGAFLNPAAQLPASETCGRISPLTPGAGWAVETMPVRRTMGDMVLLPSRDVLIINGARTGSQGWGDALTPALEPVLYNPSGAPGARFRVLAPAATVPRMYHSTANLLPDARVLVAGSNPHQYYTFDGDFPTELRVEAFSPDYLDARHARSRPDGVQAPEDVKFGADFEVRFRSQAQPQRVEVNLLSAPFTTHSFSMGQRLVRLAVTEASPAAAAADGDAGGGGDVYTITATAPPNGNVAPPSYYMLFVVSGGIPSVATWVRLA